MSKKAKKVLAVSAGIVVGIMAVVYGGVELIHSRQLAARGKTTTGQVLETEDRVRGKFRTHTYYVRVRFQSEGGASIQKNVSVDEDVFLAAQGSSSVKVFYLAEDPAVCAVGETVKLRCGNLLMGIVFLLGAGYLIVFFKAPADMEEAVENIQDSFKTLTKSQFEHAPADPRRFRHLDLAYYDGMQARLEAHGYKHVGDEENLSLRRRTVPRTFIRNLISRDHSTMAMLYHFKPGWMLGVLGAKEAKAIDLESWFSNGCFVCTSNAEMAGKLDSPPEIDALHLPAATTWDMLLETHTRRVGTYLAAHPGIEAVQLSGMPDVRCAQVAQQRIKAEFRKNRGLSKTELERIAGQSSKEVDQLHETLSQRRV